MNTSEKSSSLFVGVDGTFFFDTGLFIHEITGVKSFDGKAKRKSDNLMFNTQRSEDSYNYFNSELIALQKLMRKNLQ